MAALNRKLTDQMIENIRPPKRGRIEYRDTICKGLILRVGYTGTKSLSVIYRVSGEGGVNPNGRLLTGKQHRITFGNYPLIEINPAREKANIIKASAASGKDPRKETRAYNLKHYNNTVASVIEQFMEKHAKPTVKSWKNIECHMRLYIVPVWGKRPLSKITRNDAHELLDSIVSTGKIGTAREVKRHLCTFFNWAINREIVEHNPFSNLDRKDLRPNDNAGRALTDEELRAIWRAADKMGYPFGTAYQVLILTGQRKSEWGLANISEINTKEHWLEIPRSRYKGRRDHIVSLSKPVWNILENLPAWKGEDYYLFSSCGGKKPIIGFSKAKAKLDEFTLEILCKERDNRNTKLERYRIHDFRVTCETRLATLGFNQEIRDRVLGHAQPGLQKTYNKYDYMEEKYNAMQTYAQHIMEIVK